jgi:hypothetical protein
MSHLSNANISENIMDKLTEIFGKDREKKIAGFTSNIEPKLLT